MDISPVGVSAPAVAQASQSRTAQKAESERRAAIDSDIERKDTERLDNRAQKIEIRENIDRRRRQADAEIGKKLDIHV
jgi:hypothetical protein